MAGARYERFIAEVSPRSCRLRTPASPSALERRKTPLTVFAAALALKRHPEAAAAYRELGHEIAGHGLRWVSYQLADEATERAHLAEAVGILAEVTGTAPLGSMLPRCYRWDCTRD